ncbi:MAG: hypothetical protein R3C14_23300 [Caldilineaceae bacterium]
MSIGVRRHGACSENAPQPEIHPSLTTDALIYAAIWYNDGYG